jgi:hypothetical protein
MFNQFPPELARLLNEERIHEAQKFMRGFCCAEERRELSKAGRAPARTTTETAACTC